MRETPMIKRVRLVQPTPSGREIPERGLLISYPGALVIAILALLGSLTAGGYLYTHITRTGRQLSDARAAAAQHAHLLGQLQETHERLLRSLPTQFTPTMRPVTDAAYLAEQGETAARHIEAAQHFAGGQWADALLICEQLLDRDDLADATMRDLYAKAAWCMHHMGQTGEALALLNEASERIGHDIALAHQRADLLLFTGHPQQAAEVLQAIAEPPYSAPVAFSLANTHRALGHTDEAIAHLRLVMAHGDRDLERAAANNLALIYADDLNDFNRAHVYLTMLLSLAPEHPTSLATAGRILLLQGRYDEAEHFLQRAREQAPESVDVLIHLAALYRQFDRTDQSRALLAEARQLDPGCDEPYEQLIAAIDHAGLSPIQP
jgi:tetratricopeptide (TPR) repeat protein